MLTVFAVDNDGERVAVTAPGMRKAVVIAIHDKGHYEPLYAVESGEAYDLPSCFTLSPDVHAAVAQWEAEHLAS